MQMNTLDGINKELDSFYRKNQASLTRLQANGERELVSIYATALDTIRKKLKRIYDKHAKDGKLENGDKTTYMMLKQLGDWIETYLDGKNLDVDRFMDALTEEQYTESFYRMAYAIDQSTGIGIEWGTIPERAIEEIVHSPLEHLMKSRNFRMQRSLAVEKIRKDLALALVRGDSFQLLASRIGGVLGIEKRGRSYIYSRKGLSARALTIARTEGMRVLNKGHQDAYSIARQNGCEIEEIWDATLDGRTRPSHGLLDGKAKDVEHDGWYVEELGMYVKGPLQSGVASFDINCRCRTTCRVKGIEDTDRRIRAEGITKYQTYTQWRNSFDYASQLKYNIKVANKDIGLKDESRLKANIAQTLTMKGSFPEIDEINMKGLKSRLVRYTTDEILGNQNRAYFKEVKGKPTINIPLSIIDTRYGMETIAHEIRHYMKTRVKTTKTLQELYNDFKNEVIGFTKISPSNSQYMDLRNLVQKNRKCSVLSDMVYFLTEGKIRGLYSHEGDVISKEIMFEEIECDLHALATTDKALYFQFKNLSAPLYNLTEAFERYTIKMNGGL